MNLLLGHFDSPIDDDARDAVFNALRPLRALDYPLGKSQVRLQGSLVADLRIERCDAMMLRLVDRILQRALEEHRKAFVAEATRATPEGLLQAGWRALAEVRSAGYRHGVYKVAVADGEVIEIQVGRWDAALIKQCDEFLLETYKNNWWIFDAELSKGRVAPSALRSIVGKAA